jgi:hypothetical protein
MVDAGAATADDVERWDRAFNDRIDDVVARYEPFNGHCTLPK